MNRARLSYLMIGVAGLSFGLEPAEELSPGAREMFGAVAGRVEAERDAMFDDGAFPAAIASLAWEVIWRPYDYEVVTNLGWMYGNIERYDLELATYVRFREGFPEWAEAYYPEAEFYFKKRVYKPVAALLGQTIDFETKPHPNSYRLLAHAYDRLGNYSESLRVWEILVKLTPDDAAAVVNRDKVKRKISESGS